MRLETWEGMSFSIRRRQTVDPAREAVRGVFATLTARRGPAIYAPKVTQLNAMWLIAMR